MARASNKSPQNNLESASEVGSENSDWSRQLETLRALSQIVRDEKLSEIEVEHDGVQMTLKAPSAVAQTVMYAPFGAVEPNIEYSMSPESAPAVAATPKTETKVASGTPIVSPMVGLFYRAPSPNDASFVEVGDRIEIGQTVGLVETMKVFNEITSEIEGTVLEIKATSGALVETGDTLMTIG